MNIVKKYKLTKLLALLLSVMLAVPNTAIAQYFGFGMVEAFAEDNVLSITGDLKYGSTLTAAVTGDESASYTSFTWKRGSDESSIGSGTTHAIVADDIGKTLTVIASGEGLTDLTQTTEAIQKANGPVAPNVDYTPTEDGKATVTGLEDGKVYEYKISSDENYEDLDATTVLENDKTYNIRFAETETAEAGSDADLTVNIHTFSFNMLDHGQNIDSIYVKDGGKVTAPEDPIANGWVFKGWYKDAGCNTAYDFESVVTQDTVVYAKWVQAATVTFSLNGKTGTKPEPVTVAIGDSLGSDMPQADATHVDYYEHEGWYLDQDTTDGKQFTSSTVVEENMTVYAKWRPSMFTVTLDANGGTAASTTSITGITIENYEDKLVELEAVELTPPVNKEFKGWFTASTGGTKVTAEDLLGDVTVYAQYSWEQVTVTFDTNGKTVKGDAPDPVTVNYNTVLGDNMPENPEVDYYTFGGWFSTKGEDGTLSNKFTGSTAVTSSLTVYAKWTPVDYDITYVLGDGGSNHANNPNKYTYESEITLENPSREGYDFVKWTLDDADGDVTTGISEGSHGPVTFYANWKLHNYNITYTLGEGGVNNADNPATYTLEDAVTLKNPTRAGYDFVKWHVNGADGAETTGFAAGQKEDKTFFAEWTAAALTGTAKVKNADPDRDGIIEYGETLKATLDNGNNTGNLSYQWLRDGSNISEATSQTYTLGVGDVAAQISCKITSDVQRGDGITSVPTKAVEKAVLTMSGVSVESKTYVPGNRVATINKGTLNGLKLSDTISITENSLTGNFVDEYSGVEKAVSAPAVGFTLTGANAGGYELSESWREDLTGNITAASQTLTGKNISARAGGTLSKSELEGLFTSEAKGALSFVDAEGEDVLESDVYHVKGNSGDTETIYAIAKGKDVNGDEVDEYAPVTLVGRATITITINELRSQVVTFNDVDAADGAKSLNYVSYKADHDDGKIDLAAKNNTDETEATKLGGFSYVSSDTSVATVDASGVVTLEGTGETTITATAASTSYYNSGSASYVLTVTETEASVPVPAANLIYTGEAQTGVDADAAYALSDTYSAINAGNYVATATLNTGYVWAVTEGKVTENTKTYPQEISWTIKKAATTGDMSALNAVTGTDPTSVANNDGKLNGTTANMEYSTDITFTNPIGTTCGASETTGLPDGTYYVRYKADENHEASTAKEITLAKYIERTVTFNLNGKGTISGGTTATVKSGTVVAEPTVTDVPTGWKIEGWYTDNDTFENKWTFESDEVNADTNLYANWQLIDYTITLNVEAGVTIDDEDWTLDQAGTAYTRTYTVEDGTITLPTNAEKQYNTFSKWVLTSDKSTEMATVTCSTGGDVACTATWDLTEYTITLETNGGVLTGVGWTQVTENENYTRTYSYAATGTVTIPDTVTMTAYDFDGWKVKGTADDPAKGISVDKSTPDDVTYVAVWTPKTYVMTLNTGDGTILDDDWVAGSAGTYTRNYTIEDEFTLPTPHTTEERMAFTGWTGTDVSDPTEDVEISGVYGARAYTAHWLPVLDATVTISKDNTENVYEYGDNLTASCEIINPTENYGAVSYQWFRGEDEITGATTKNYRITADDIGSTLRCVVSTANTYGTAESDSTSTVVKATLTIQVSVASKTYDGTTAATINYTNVSGAKNGENHAPSDTSSITGDFEDQYVGTAKEVTTNTFFVPSGDVSGYNVVPDGLTGNITAATQAYSVANITMGQGETLSNAKLGELVTGVHGNLTFTQTTTNGVGTYNAENGFAAVSDISQVGTKTEDLQVTAAAIDLNEDDVPEYVAYTNTDKVITVTVNNKQTQQVTFNSIPDSIYYGEAPIVITAVSKIGETTVTDATITYVSSDTNVAEFGTGADANKLTIKKAGTTKLTATATHSDYNDGVASIELTVLPAVINASEIIPTVLTKKYTGSTITILENGTGYAVGGEYSATEVDTYTVTLSLASSDFIWSDNTTADKTFNWSITKADAQKSAPTGLTAITPTNTNNVDGAIDGLDANETYEYALSGSSNWMQVTGVTKVEDLASGTYRVRFINDDSTHYMDNPSATVVIESYTPSEGGGGGGAKVAVTGVSIVPKTAQLTLSENKVASFTATIAPANATNKTLTWTQSSTNGGEVQISNAKANPVTVTAVKAGTVTLTVTTTDGSKTDTATITITEEPEKDKAATPTFTPAPGSYSEKQNVTIATTTAGAAIYYTVDGTEPTTASTAYTAPIAVEKTTTIKAIAVKEGMDNSEVATGKYEITNKVSAPTFSPAAGTYTVSQNVVISTETAGAVIHYTTDDSTPTENSLEYKSPILVEKTTTIKAIAVKGGMENSDVVTAKYVITKPDEVWYNPSVTWKPFPTKWSKKDAIPTVSYSVTYTSSVDSKRYTVDGLTATVTPASVPADAKEVTFTATADLSAYFQDKAGTKKATNVMTSKTYKFSASGDEGQSGQEVDPEGDITIDGIDDTYPWTGKQIKPAFKVYDNVNGRYLAKNVDYTVKYGKNKKPGEGTVTITGKGNYAKAGTAAKFTIVKEELSDPAGVVKNVAKPAKAEYTGSPIYPKEIVVTLADNSTVTMTHNGDGAYYNKDTSGKELAVSVIDNINKGTATVAVRGAQKDGKDVVKTTTFSITAKSMKNATADGSGFGVDISSTADYRIKNTRPEVSITFNGDELIEGQDYKVTTNLKKGNVKIEGKNNFNNKFEQTFTITPLDLSECKMATATAYEGIMPSAVKVTILDPDGNVVPTKCYTLTPVANSYTTDSKGKLTAGDITLKATATTKDANIKADSEIEETFAVAKNVGKASFKVNGSVVYTGSAIEPDDDWVNKNVAVTYKANGTSATLKAGTDFEITGYTNNVKKGKMTVYVSGTGEYSGTKNFKVKITTKNLGTK